MITLKDLVEWINAAHMHNSLDLVSIEAFCIPFNLVEKSTYVHILNKYLCLMADIGLHKYVDIWNRLKKTVCWTADTLIAHCFM